MIKPTRVKRLLRSFRAVSIEMLNLLDRQRWSFLGPIGGPSIIMTLRLHAAVVALLISLLPYGSSAAFVPCKGDSFSAKDASFLGWLIEEELSERSCERLSEEEKAFLVPWYRRDPVEVVVEPACDAVSCIALKRKKTIALFLEELLISEALGQSEGWVGSGKPQSITEVWFRHRFSANQSVLDDVVQRLHSLPCLTTISARGAAALNFLTSDDFRRLSVKDLEARISGTQLSRFFRPKYSCGSSCDDPIELRLPPSLLTLKIWGSDEEPRLWADSRIAVLPSLPKGLQKLAIKHTRIGGKLPQRLPENIRHVELGGNLFEGGVPSEWAKAAKLEVFAVHEERLRDSVVLNDKNVWPGIKDIDVCLGHPKKRAQPREEFVRKSSNASQLLCFGFGCNGSGCERSLQCFKTGKGDARLVTRSQNYTELDMKFAYHFDYKGPFRFFWDSPCYDERMRDTVEGGCPDRSSSPVQIAGVRMEGLPSGRRSVEELFDLLKDLPCLQTLHIHHCPGWMAGLGTLHQLRNFTLTKPSTEDCPKGPTNAKSIGMIFPPNLEILKTQGIRFGPGELSTSALPHLEQLDVADSGLPEDLPAGLDHLRIELDPALEWVIPKAWAELTRLETMAIEGTSPSDRLQLQLTPVFDKMRWLEVVDTCLRTTPPNPTRLQFCNMDYFQLRLCTYPKTFGCGTDFALATGLSWMGVGLVILLFLCGCVCSVFECEPFVGVVHRSFGVVSLGAICSCVWLIVETFPSIFAKVMLGIGALHYVVFMLSFWISMKHTEKHACFPSDARESEPGMLDTAWFSWRFRGGRSSRCLSTTLIVLAAPLVLELAGLFHTLTGRKIPRVTSEMDLRVWLYWRIVLQGLTASAFQAVLQSIVFNLPLAKFFDMVGAHDVPLWVLALTLVLSELSILLAVGRALSALCGRSFA
ncbi:hypothetical protein BSKO_09225 [Bryopsis sp. KO-2023]|nr:hypothetical protein BSKO_09225 [Bryopsis sp. KO-2023]